MLGAFFVIYFQKAKENGACNKDCWEGCDDFKATGPHDYCVHCDDTTCTNCQCCRGWCDQKVNNIEPTPAKFVRLAFHQCLLYVLNIFLLLNRPGFSKNL